MANVVTHPGQDSDFALAGLSKRARVWLLTVACFGVLLVISSMVALNTALPDIAIATSADQTQLTWIVDSYTLVLACLLLPAGALGDRYGRRGAMLVGLAIFGAASLVSAVLSNPVIVIVSRGVAGVGAALIMPATLSLITAAYPKDQRNKAVGIWAGVAGSGAVIGMLGSGGLLNFWSWHSIFWAFAGAALTILVLTLTIASSRDADVKPLDWRGALVIGGAVATLVFGILEAPARGWTHPLVIISIGIGLLLSLAFGFVEVRQRYPLLDVRLFAVPAFATGAATITVFFLSMFGYMFLLMQYMQLILGYSPNKTALALSPLLGPMLVLSVLSFWYLPRLGLRAVVFSGLLLIATGSILHARHQSGFTLLASSLADAGDEHRYRIVHRTDDVGDHDDRARRQAGSGLSGQRRQPGNRCRARYRASRVDAGRAVCEDVGSQPDRIPEIGGGRREHVAGPGAGGRATAGTGGCPTVGGQQDGVHRCHAFVAVGARRAGSRQCCPDRTVGTGA